MKKRQSEASHFKRRLIERYDLVVNHSMVNDMLSLIGTNKCHFIYKCSNTKYVYEIYYRDKSIKVLYDKLRKMYDNAIIIDRNSI